MECCVQSIPTVENISNEISSKGFHITGFWGKKTSSIISKQLNNSKFTFKNKQQQEFSQNLKITFRSSEILWWIRLYEFVKMLSIRNLCWKPIVSGCTKRCFILIWICNYNSYFYLQWKSRWVYTYEIEWFK